MNQYDTIKLPACAEIRADFVMTATGSGMSGCGIQDGDYVYIRQQDTADNGDIVAILVDGEPTLRRYFEGNGVVFFTPGAASIPPIIADPTTMPQIIGKAVGLTRVLERCWEDT